MTSPETAVAPTTDEINRLWQHGLHEERIFHDRLNYFTALELGLLSVAGIIYGKQPPRGLLVALAAVALVFTLLWWAIQARHWRYWTHVNERLKALVPEYRATTSAMAEKGGADGFSLTRPLAFAVPSLFAVTWAGFLAWLLASAALG